MEDNKEKNLNEDLEQEDTTQKEPQTESQEEPKDLSAAADMAFIFIRTKMDMETEARKEYCRKQQERGKLGGRPKKNPEESKEKK